MKIKQKKNLINILQNREYGFKFVDQTNRQLLRILTLPESRKWVIIYKNRMMGDISPIGDLMLTSTYGKARGTKVFTMRRIKLNGTTFKKWSSANHKDIQRIQINQVLPAKFHPELNDTVMRPSLFLMSETVSNGVKRLDLLNGTLYDHIIPSNKQCTKPESLMCCANSNIISIITKSNPPSIKCTRTFHIILYEFQPFIFNKEFTISSAIIPCKEDQKCYGVITSIEIIHGMLMVHTSKKYALFYHIANLKLSESGLVTECPPLLYSTYACEDYVSIGGYPWLIFRKLENQHFKVESLLNEEKDNFTIETKVSVYDNHLEFFPNDTNQIIHWTCNHLRILNKTDFGFEETFCYPTIQKHDSTPTTSRFGRTYKNIRDDSTDFRKLAYDYDDEIETFIVLECNKYGEDRTILEKITFYDGYTMKELRTVPIGIIIGGFISCHHFSIEIDRDVINIIIKTLNYNTLIHLRALGFDDERCNNVQESIKFNSNSVEEIRDPDWQP